MTPGTSYFLTWKEKDSNVLRVQERTRKVAKFCHLGRYF